MAKIKIPARLYKHRAFSNRALEMLVADQLYFADPSTFNDPLDTKPSLKTDIGADQLAQILSQLVVARTRAEMTAAARSISYRGPRTVDHIEKHSLRRAQELIEDIRYNATDPEYEIDDPERYLFGQYVEAELLRRYDRGVLSLGTRADCPLMWSHYGDQHKGICIGYSVPKDMEQQVHKVRYGGSREIKASLVAEMLKGSAEARQQVDEAVLFRKAHAWNYEKEWRLIGSRGSHGSELDLKEIVFGMRCEASVKYAIVKALEDRAEKVRFYEIRVMPGRFLLQKRALDLDDLKQAYPVCNRDIKSRFRTFADGQ